MKDHAKSKKQLIEELDALRRQNQNNISDTSYREIFNASNDAIFVHDVSNGAIIDVNKAMLNMYGYSREEVLKLSVEDFSMGEPPYSGIEAEAWVRKAVQEGPQLFEWMAKKHNGQLFWVEVNLKSAFIGGQDRMLAIVRDIGDRKKTEGALKDSEERYRRITESITDYIYTVRIQKNKVIKTVHSDGCIAVTGYTAGDFAADPSLWIRMVVPEDRSIVEQQAKRILAGEITPAVEHRIIRKDGNQRWIRNTIVPRYDNQGQLISYDGLIQDITGQKTSELSLKESEEKFRVLFDQAADLVAMIDEKGNFLDLNIKFEEESLWKRSEMIGKNVMTSGIVSDESVGKIADSLSRLFQGQDIPMFEIEGVRIDGARVPYEVRATPIKKEGKIMAVQATLRNITDRKKAEEALGRYKVLAESSRDILLFIRRGDGNILEANRAAVQTYGYTRDELLGMNLRTLRLPEEQSLVSEQMRQADESGLLLETSHVRKDGSLVPVEISARGITVNGERIILSIIRDITERKKAETELLRQKEFTEKLLESLPGIFFLYDSTCHLKRWNKAHETAMGFTADELRDWYIPDWHETPEDAAAGMALVKSVLETGVGGAFETTLINKEGRFVPYLITITRLMTPDGPVMMGVGIDITERKKIEEALRMSEEKYRLVVENATEAIFIIQDGRITFPNHCLVVNSGYTEEELTNAPFSSFLYDDDKDMVVDMHWKRLQGEKVPPLYSFRIVNKAGGIVWVEAGAVLISWQGRPATLNFLRDITIQKKLEQQLFQAQKMEAIGTLAGGIAHDFNNLLMGILGYTSLMLLKTDKTHPFHEKLKTIEELVASGSDLTKQLLGFARGGKYEVKPVDVNALIIKTSEIFERTKKEIVIHKKLQDDLKAVEADAGQIEQVLLNLYVNAWQAMPSGGRLFLETQNVELDESQSSAFTIHPGTYVKISVADTGVGMDPETQERIFEPFFSTKGRGKGTGLGLASAYGIIKNHGGVINVYSERGHGTTFTLYLPASDTKTAEAKPSEGSLLTGHETILIVDDERANTESVKELLEILGYTVMVANSGEESIRLYRKLPGKIQLVILDMIMPEMGGKETLVKLKEIDKDVCILLASGYSIDGEAKSIIDLGCKGFIQKPFRVEELSRKIREVLDRQPAP